ncbi:hypothetical protein HETIRDRAFT_155103 [Heterobasidion irregulare TC 32-1]|uniref:Actin cytoskeleton-regulatory complex protein SLA1 n=1 Tax=Heterobasidion irregulare (strain TC 32-1) TaxID=747525 RepID=W4KEV7_HETIT|nr:uncharacterized protein HETIRDRAFT_155103 [Heterobasidion irregulare TC 32-1]ETW83601.1 hypothetical protein HETIRDRAFT_155103 [Heterobasidion irregulare TC 32-1]
MSTDAQHYLAVLRASYDYAPQSDDEIAIREDQLLLLVERTDDDWWKVRPRADSPDAEEQPAGLVPSAYVDQAPTVKAQYAYDAVAPGELTVAEDDLLHTFGPAQDGWLLVQARGKDGAGYVPANYVEESTEEAEEAVPVAAAPILANIVVPDSAISTYADPADLVASSTKARAAAPAASDPIQTWSVSEVDRKGKKKKGTLGVGNGAVFFASESDKTPVQKWQMADVASAKIDKAKHILIEIGSSGGGSTAPASLHFHAGSKDAAEAIAAKLDASRALAAAASAAAESGSSSGSGVGDGVGAGPGAGKKGASVHFSEQGPAIIPPREDGDEEDGAAEDDEGEGEEGEEGDSDPDAAGAHAGEAAVALYDFAAQGDDEMSVAEGEALWIVERDGDEWWKCRNAKGEEGVVPASYVEVRGASGCAGPAPSGSGAPAPAPLAVAAAEEDEVEEADDSAAQEAEARASAERAQKERKKIEQEQRAKAAAAAAAEVDRKRKERDAREAEQKAKERAEADVRKRETPSPSPSPSPRPSSSSSSSKPRASTDQSPRSSIDKRGPPPSEKTRVWHDRSGQFRVEAAFLGFANGKIRLHKVNGVVIEVPSEKMSVEDMRFVERVTGRPQPQRRASDDDDEPLAHRRSSLKVPPRSATAPPSAAPAPKKPTIDWFEFFLNAGCDVDDCTRYASAFERDKMDAQILPDITESTMRSLGLREGDIIRVRKAIAARAPPLPSAGSGAGAGDAEQLRRDEELARQLQVEESKRPVASPPKLFTAGPGGALKSTRRGRPPPSKSGPLASVELGAIATASDQIQRSSTPQVSSAAGSAAPSPAPASVLVPATASVQSPAPPPPSGFDDDAWTPRPSSTKPAATPTPTPPVLEPRAPSAPPAPPAPPAPAPVAARVSSPPAAALQPQPTSGGNLAKTTESDIFDQLARLSQLRVRSPPAVSLGTSAGFNASASAAPSPSIVSPPPGGYAQGMGMGSSPVPLGQHLHAQQTGLLPPPRAPSVGGGVGASGPRGPYAPVPANQTLLQPLIPTTTGFGGFVPTRGAQASPFQQQQQSPFQQQQPLQFQQPSFLSAQPTGFGAQPMLPQQTGFQMSGPLMSQPTGFGGYGGGGAPPPPPPVPPLPSFQSSNSFGQMQPSPTGFNTGFGQPPSFNGGGMHTGLPQQQQQQQQQGKDTSPANIFAQMKAGTFANDAAPQSSDKYDALRPAPAQLTAQPTGWGYPGFPGGYGGYQ